MLPGFLGDAPASAGLVLGSLLSCWAVFAASFLALRHLEHKHRVTAAEHGVGLLHALIACSASGYFLLLTDDIEEAGMRHNLYARYSLVQCTFAISVGYFIVTPPPAPACWHSRRA